MIGAETYLGALVVAGRSAHPALGIAVNRQSFYVDHASAYSLVWFSGFAYAQGKRVALELVGIKSTDAVSVSYTCKVYEVYQGVYLVECLALQHSSYEGF